MPRNFRTVLCHLWLSGKILSNVKLGGFRSQLQAPFVSSDSEELWYNEVVCLWMTTHTHTHTHTHIYIYIYIYIVIHRQYTVWIDKTVAIEKTTWFHFRLMKTGFLFFFFFFFADHLLVGQLCTNPKRDMSLLSCLKVAQCSTSEIGDAPLYNSCTLPIQVITTGPLPSPPKYKSGRFNVFRVRKTKFPATVMVFSVVSSEVHIMPPHIFEVSLKVNTKVHLDVLKSVVIPWCNQVAGGRPWVWQQASVPAHKSKETQAWHQKECYDFVFFCPPSSPDLNPLDYFVCSYVEKITNMISHNTKASMITAIRWVFAELPPALVEKACSQFRIRIEVVIEAEGGCIE